MGKLGVNWSINKEREREDKGERGHRESKCISKTKEKGGEREEREMVEAGKEEKEKKEEERNSDVGH